MKTRLFQHVAAGILALLLAAELHASEGGQQMTVDGLLSVYVGVLPASMLLEYPKGHRERDMHGGVPGGANRYHVVIAIFEAASGVRVKDASVIITGSNLGMAQSRQKAEPMLVNNVTTYGAYVTLAGAGPYKIQVEIKRPGVGDPSVVVFDYPFTQ